MEEEGKRRKGYLGELLASGTAGAAGTMVAYFLIDYLTKRGFRPERYVDGGIRLLENLRKRIQRPGYEN